MADIELVIKIPEEMYQKIKETNRFISGGRSGKRFDYILFNAINTGIPLPKWHGRLIDEYAIMRNAKSIQTLCDISNVPTIIEANTTGLCNMLSGCFNNATSDCDESEDEEVENE